MIHDCLSALCTFFTLVVGEKLVDSNPEYELILPERKQIAPKILTLSQIVKCLNAPTNAYQLRHISLQNALRDAMILHLFCDRGMGRHELQKIKLRDIDFQNRALTVLGKGNKERICTFTEAVSMAINRYQSKLLPDTNAYHFIHCDGKILSIQAIW
jgi:site-specific recombinase XerD